MLRLLNFTEVFINTFGHFIISNVFILYKLLFSVFNFSNDPARRIFSPEVNFPEFVYNLVPNPERVNVRWQTLLSSFFLHFSKENFFYTPVNGGKWIHLQESILRNYPEDVPIQVQETVDRVYEICEQNLVHLPGHVLRGINITNMKSGEVVLSKGDYREENQDLQKQQYTFVSQEHVRGLLHKDRLPFSKLLAGDKLLLLHYFCLHDDHRLIENLPLLPLADGTFRTFNKHETFKVFVCRNKTDLDLFPKLKHRLIFITEHEGVLRHIQQLAKKGKKKYL